MDDKGQKLPPVSAMVLNVCNCMTTGQLVAGFQSFPSGGCLNHVASTISHTAPGSEGSACRMKAKAPKRGRELDSEQALGEDPPS